MHFSVMTLVLCAACAAAWAALGWYCWRDARRRARHQAEWA